MTTYVIGAGHDIRDLVACLSGSGFLGNRPVLVRGASSIGPYILCRL